MAELTENKFAKDLWNKMKQEYIKINEDKKSNTVEKVINRCIEQINHTLDYEKISAMLMEAIKNEETELVIYTFKTLQKGELYLEKKEIDKVMVNILDYLRIKFSDLWENDKFKIVGVFSYDHFSSIDFRVEWKPFD